MGDGIRLRARIEGDLTRVAILVRHPMSVAQRGPAGEETAPAHFIEELRFAVNDRVLVRAHMGPGIARNPYLAFDFRGGRPGDTLSVHWRDNRGAEEHFQAALE